MIDHLSQLEEKIINTEKARAEAMENNKRQRQQLCERLEQLNREEFHRKKIPQTKKIFDTWASLPPPADDLTGQLSDRYEKAVAEFRQQEEKHQVEEEWRQWASRNKKEELCRDAEQLDNETDLQTVEKTIRQLQKLWKQTGPVYGKASQKLWKRFQEACNRNFTRCEPLLEERRQTHKKNIHRKEELCRQADEIAKSTEWQKTADALKAMQAEWKSLDTGRTSGREKRLYQKFRKACNHFFARRSADFKEHDQERRENLSRKEDLCAQAEAMADDPRPEYGREFRNLQKLWKKAGAAPRKQEEKTWKRFRAACDRYFSWLAEQRHGNVEAKEELCRLAREICATIDSQDKLGEADKQLENIKNKWHETGPVSREKEQSLNSEFQKTLSTFYALRQQFYAERDRERYENMTRKEALVEQAEQIAAGPSSPEAAAALKDLQKQWQTIGSAPREHEKILFKNFQSAGNAYFEGRRQEVEENQQQRLDNQKKKEALIVELENIVGTNYTSDMTDNTNSALNLAEQLKIAMESNTFMAGKRDDRQRQKEEVKRIQQAWKKIGPADRNQEQKLWKRYRTLLDTFFSDNSGKGKEQPTKR